MASPQHSATASPSITDDVRPLEEPSPGPKALAAFILGLTLLIATSANLSRLAAWADDYGTVLVYLAFFLVMSIAGRLFWWGVDTLIAIGRDRDRSR